MRKVPDGFASYSAPTTSHVSNGGGEKYSTIPYPGGITVAGREKKVISGTMDGFSRKVEYRVALTCDQLHSSGLPGITIPKG